MKSLSIGEAKFIYYAHNKLDYTQLGKVRQIEELMKNKFPESDRSIDANSYYKALNSIADGNGVPKECVLCGMKLDDENMMCTECDQTVRSMASRGYKEMKEVLDSEVKKQRFKKIIRVLIIVAILLVCVSASGLIVYNKLSNRAKLDKRLKAEGYVAGNSEDHYSYTAEDGSKIIYGNEPVVDNVHSGEIPSAVEANEAYEIATLDVTSLDTKDAYNMIGRSLDTVWAVYGKHSMDVNNTLYYEESGISLVYEDGIVVSVYTDVTVPVENRIPICGIYTGVDPVSILAELENYGIVMNQIKLDTWEGLFQVSGRVYGLKITEIGDRVGIISLNPIT